MRSDPAHICGPSRRAVVVGSAAWSAVAAVADLAVSACLSRAGAGAQAPGEPFAPDHVRRLAGELAKSAFAKPVASVPAPFDALTAEQYREIRFRPDQTIWRGEDHKYELQLFPMGWIYDSPVEIWIVDEGGAQAQIANEKLFTLGRLETQIGAPFGFSGFGLDAPLNRADVVEEFAAFQGASYFRAIGRGQQYGLLARGLAINTARPGGEEFPLFRAFWIERPRRSDDAVVVHALLDSASTTGAYRFAIAPGPATVMDVEATLYPRKTVAHFGIAPLTSMFLFGPAHNRQFADVRPAVHDSEGLAIVNGRGEHIWRPLTNPKMLQASAFIDRDPKGFGLVQRTRAFAAYDDLDSRYELRPTAWVEPKESWGKGFVELIEIPAEEEIHDNIVAYWKPEEELEPGKTYTYRYRISWGEDVPASWSAARTVKTRVGPSKKGDTTQFVVDLDGPAVAEAGELPEADVSASAGTLANLLVQRNPGIRGVRVRFELATAGTELIELRLALKRNGQQISESWLYRWTKS